MKKTQPKKRVSTRGGFSLLLDAAAIAAAIAVTTTTNPFGERNGAVARREARGQVRRVGRVDRAADDCCQRVGGLALVGAEVLLVVVLKHLALAGGQDALADAPAVPAHKHRLVAVLLEVARQAVAARLARLVLVLHVVHHLLSRQQQDHSRNTAHAPSAVAVCFQRQRKPRVGMGSTKRRRRPKKRWGLGGVEVKEREREIE